MKIMAVNAGSSSLKFQLLEMPSEKVFASGQVERIGSEKAVFTIRFNGNKFEVETKVPNHVKAASLVLDGLIEHKVLKSLDEIIGVGHRVVHGGELFKSSALINNDVINKIASLNHLAPLHNPANIIGIQSFLKAIPNVNHVAVFDTAFHQTMEPVTFLYATPYEWYEKYGIRKYGFHGTSHQYVYEKAIELLNNKKAKVVICHLGNGASLAAIDSGKVIDTSMGLTPLEGIPMGTRSGNIDPAIMGVIGEKEEKTLFQVLDDLNMKSGYLGVSGVSNDSRDIVDGMNKGHVRSRLAFEIQVKRIADYIGSYYVLLGGLDAICFTAGIGENSVEIREMILNRLTVLGIKVDHDRNKVRGVIAEISTEDSKIKALVIPTDEEVMLAREALKFVGK